MTHLSFNWPPDRPEFGLATGSDTDPDLAEAVGLSIALKYFASRKLDLEATAPWRAATDQALSAAGKLDPGTSTT
ncbi:MAG: hypothetical protein GKS03_11640 [Alphaproteobacteria bacterium]|nr:hypothetical protein [Alphaproteobacteria bacterium]